VDSLLNLLPFSEKTNWMRGGVFRRPPRGHGITVKR
jgi:hypothetical protein